MPERYSLTDATDLAAAAPEIRERATVSPGDDAPAVRRAGAIEELRWGLLPRWRGHGGKRPPMIYEARLDELDATPLLRDAFAKQRCLVLADGFYERGGRDWAWFAAGGLTALAGVWATSKDDDRPSFALLVDGDGRPLEVARTAWDAWLVDALNVKTLAVAPAWKRRERGNPNQGSLF